MGELRQADSNKAVSAADIEKIILEKPSLLRTLPAFFNIQVLGACPQACSICPWPSHGGTVPVTERKELIPKATFASLLDRIEEFAGDAVIDLSLWGELSLHPEHFELIEMVLARPALSLVIETSGIGWKEDELKALAAIQVAARKNHMAPLSWIVSLDAFDPERYKELRGPGFSEAQSCAKTLLSLFPNDAYVQAVRLKGAEDDIEKFYRFWKGENSKQVIIQKYDDFSGTLPKMQAADLSPVKRRPCWHIQRDMNILLDGRVPGCKENLAALKEGADVLGNAFSDDLTLIWEKGVALYNEHCKAEYHGICALCDEYYTYNF
jgi:spiro-SPASM protein